MVSSATMSTFPVERVSGVEYFLLIFPIFVDYRSFALADAAFRRVVPHAAVTPPVAARRNGAIAGASSVGRITLLRLLSRITTVTSYVIDLQHTLVQTMFVRLVQIDGNLRYELFGTHGDSHHGSLFPHINCGMSED